MPIIIKNSTEIAKMQAAGKLAAEVLIYLKPFVQIGISTLELNNLAHEFIVKHGGIPAPLNYHGFPKSICTSVNNVICHGIPSAKEILKAGDIVNLDVTVIKDGYHGDTSQTFLVGEVAENIKNLVKRTERAMWEGISVVKPGADFAEIGKAIEKYLHKFNYGIVREYTGHGIGKNFHEDPYVLHYINSEKLPKMQEGMIFTIEPMVNLSPRYQTVLDPKDHWTVRTKDSAVSAQFEHTVLVTKDGVEVLTQI